MTPIKRVTLVPKPGRRKPTQELNVEWVRGNYARFPKKALRIAMLLASLENDGHIELHHWARAQEITERWRTSLHELDRQVNEISCQDTDEMEEKILNLLAKKEQALTAREVSQGVRGLDTAEATKKLDLLVKSGDVESERIGKKVVYKLMASVDM